MLDNPLQRRLDESNLVPLLSTTALPYFMTYRPKINELTETRQSKTREHGKFLRVSVGQKISQFARDLLNIFIQYLKVYALIVADCRLELRYAPIENCLLCKRSRLSSPATAIVKDSFRTLFQAFFFNHLLVAGTRKDTDSVKNGI